MACARHALILVGFGVLFLPAVALGQTQTPKAQIHTGVPSQALFNSSLQDLGKSEQEIVSYRLVFVGEKNSFTPPFEAAGISGGELLGRVFFPHTIPPPPFASLWDSSTGASEPATNAGGFAGDRLRDLQQVLKDAQKSLTILEGNSKTFAINLGHQPSADVTSTISGHENTNLILDKETLTFPQNQWRVSKQLGLMSTPNIDDVDEHLTLTFTASDWNTEQPVTLTAGQDNDLENETGTLWMTASGGGYDRERGNVDFEIIDDNTPVLDIPQTLVVIVYEGYTSYLPDNGVKLTAQPPGNVEVEITGYADTALDTTASTPRKLTFTTGNWNKAQAVGIAAKHDTDFVNTAYTLTFTAMGSISDTKIVHVWVVDDDTPGLVVTPTSMTVDEGRSKTFTVELKVAPSSDVTVSISVDQGTDGELDLDPINPSTLTFTSSDWDQKQRVSLAAKHDDDFNDESEILTLTATGGSTDTKTVHVWIADDDTPGLVVTPTSVVVDEGKTATFTVRLDGPPSSDVDVTIAGYKDTDLDTAASAPRMLTFTSSDWGEKQTVTLGAKHDADSMDDAETLTLTATGGFADTKTVKVTIKDDEARIDIDPQSVIVAEGGTATFTVKLGRQPSGNVTVTVPTPVGDLTAVPSVLRFTAGNWSTPQPVTLSAAQDDDGVADETETLRLTASGADYNDVTAEVSVTIKDDDEGTIDDEGVIVAPDVVPITEGSTTTFEVSLSDAPSANVTVTLNGYEGTDLADTPPSPLSLTFAPADYDIPQTVTLSAAEDPDILDEETITLRLSASGGGYAGVTADVTVTIEDDDEGTIDDEGVIVAPDVVPITEGSTTTFEVSLSDAPSANVTVTLNGYEGTDLADTPPSPLSLTFTPADYDIPQTVTLSAAEDPDILDEETITLRLSASGGGYAGVTADVTVTIEDDDEGTIDYEGVIVAPDVVPIREGSTTAFDVSLSDAPSANVTVTLSGYENTDLAGTPPRPLSLIFTPLNYYMPRSVTITASEDEDGFFDEYVTLHLSASDAEYMGVTADVTVRIRDNDTGTIVVPALVIMEEGSERTMEVVLAQMPSSLVTVSFSGYAGTDLSLNGPPLTFTTANWNISQTVVLMAAEDHDLEHDIETLMLTASGGGYTGVMAKTAVTIADNDTAEIVADGEVLMDEGDTYSLPVRLSAQPSAFVTVTFSGHAGTDLALDKATLTFTAADWQTPKQVTLTAIEDDEDYADETIGLTLTASGGDYDEVEAMVPVTIMDNDEEAPLSISIHDAQGVENAGRLQLPIILNRPIDQVVTVQYASTDGTAEAGEDYTTSRGIVIFDPGATRGVIEIEVTDDELPEGAETFMVTLSQPRNAIIARETGTGTILDDDGGTAILRVDDALVLEEEGMVQFRVSLSHPQRQLITAAYQTQDGTARAGEDYEASSGVVTLAPGTVEAMIAVPLLKDGLDWQEETFTMHLVSSKHAEIAKAVGVATIQESTTVSEAVLEAYSARFVRTSSAQIVEALGERFRSGADGAACGAADRAEMAQLWYSASEWDPSLGELLSGCRMSASSYSGAFSVWGRGAFRQFNGRTDDALTLNGAVTTGMLGADYRWQRGWLAGVLLAHSRGDGSFEVVEQSGEITAGLTGVYPYVSYTRAGWDVWLSAGAGRGQAEVLELKGDLVSRFGAMGVRGTLMSGGTIGLNYHGDVLVTDAELKDHAVTAEVYRVRAGVEANAKISDGLRPYVEASVRSDGGSAETGIGLEFGGGIRVDYPAWRLKGDVRTQGLVMHTAEGFTEWGLSGSLQVGSRSEGLMVRVRPTWGRGQGMSVYGQQTILDAAPIGAHAHRTELELGYGIPWKDGTARSVMGMTQLPQGMMYRLGGEFHPWERLTFSVFGLTHSRATALEDLGVNVRGSLRY